MTAAPLEYINAPATIAQLENMVSINSCISADLYGQVCAESAGLRHISGTGGQLDYLTGAADAKGGKAFICMTSSFVDKAGVRRSRILPHFEGDIVTDPRSQAYYIVTEFGAVNLAGRSTRRQSGGPVHLGAGGAADLHCPPGLPGGADRRGGTAEDLAPVQQALTDQLWKFGKGTFAYDRARDVSAGSQPLLYPGTV